MTNRTLVAAVLAGLMLSAPFVEAATIPRKAPDFATNLGNGKQARLSDHKGKVVALIFILTGCPHCQDTVKALSKAQAEFGAKGFQALGSAINPDAPSQLPMFRQQFQPAFPVGASDVKNAMEYMQIPPMVNPMMPMLAFIDRQGVIQAQYTGRDAFLESASMEKNIRAKIQELLKPAPAAKGKKPAPKR